jgi:hypothetical protein
LSLCPLLAHQSKAKLPLVLARKAGDLNPFLIGTSAVRRYLTVAGECAKAGLAQLNAENRR